jgi:hypothetical protein
MQNAKAQKHKGRCCCCAADALAGAAQEAERAKVTLADNSTWEARLVGKS